MLETVAGGWWVTVTGGGARVVGAFHPLKLEIEELP
jgi:hypothetical protein